MPNCVCSVNWKCDNSIQYQHQQTNWIWCLRKDSTWTHEKKKHIFDCVAHWMCECRTILIKTLNTCVCVCVIVWVMHRAGTCNYFSVLLAPTWCRNLSTGMGGRWCSNVGIAKFKPASVPKDVASPALVIVVDVTGEYYSSQYTHLNRNQIERVS